MTQLGLSVGLAAVLLLTSTGCKKGPSASDAPAGSAPATASSTGAGAALSGLDPCLVGNWKSTSVSLKLAPASAAGGANLVLEVQPSGDSVLDFASMAPIHGKSNGADFDFKYAGRAGALLSTPTRGALASAKPDYSGLRVSADVQLPGVGRFSVLKDKPVSELAQMASALAGQKAPSAAAAATPPGIDPSPIFSTTRYACQGDTLTFFADKGGAEWAFSRTRP
jgi:hypothetical protein